MLLLERKEKITQPKIRIKKQIHLDLIGLSYRFALLKNN